MVVSFHEYAVLFDVRLLFLSRGAAVDGTDEFLVDRRIVAEQLQARIRYLAVHDDTSLDVVEQIRCDMLVLYRKFGVIPAFDADLPERQQEQGQGREALLPIDDLVDYLGGIVL